jgi:hypothetical protein
MRVLFLVMFVWVITLISACSTTNVKVSNYYEPKDMAKQYRLGKTFSIDELRSASNKYFNKQAGDWKTHRQYKKSYYFE